MLKPITLIMSAFFACFMASSLAGQDSCDPSDVHCAYSNDSNQGAMKGNYIKLVWPEAAQDKIQIACMPYSGAVSIDSEAIEEAGAPVGQNTWLIYVCKDANCTTEQQVATDQFSLAKDGKNNYITTPTFSFNFANRYPAVTCPMSAAAISKGLLIHKHK